MDCRAVCSISKRRYVLGVSLVEYLIGIAVGGLVLAVVLSLSLYSMRSFADLANYVELNAGNITALDYLTRDARQAAGLIDFATNKISLNDGSTNPINYYYVPEAGTLTRQKGTDSRVLLSGCDSLQFFMYQRFPQAGAFEQYPAADATNCKVLSIRWSCSRTILGRKVNSEDVQEAKIAFRTH